MEISPSPYYKHTVLSHNVISLGLPNPYRSCLKSYDDILGTVRNKPPVIVKIDRKIPRIVSVASNLSATYPSGPNLVYMTKPYLINLL